MIYIYNTGWWLTYPSEKYEFVSWDYEIPNMWKNMSQTTKQFYSYVSRTYSRIVDLHVWPEKNSP